MAKRATKRTKRSDRKGVRAERFTWNEGDIVILEEGSDTGNSSGKTNNSGRSSSKKGSTGKRLKSVLETINTLKTR